MRAYMIRRYHAKRAEALRILGGVCAVCGSQEGLEIDHKDPKDKTAEASNIMFLGRKRFLEELARCQLLCDQHHNQKTVAEKGHQRAVGTHGTLSAYRYCHCEDCRAAKSRHHAAWKISRNQTANLQSL
jgi:5-methylcytosine-specific restriction endonuclease McrA